jgi:hypothetical protein
VELLDGTVNGDCCKNVMHAAAMKTRLLHDGLVAEKCRTLVASHVSEESLKQVDFR